MPAQHVFVAASQHLLTVAAVVVLASQQHRASLILQNMANGDDAQASILRAVDQTNDHAGTVSACAAGLVAAFMGCICWVFRPNEKANY